MTDFLDPLGEGSLRDPQDDPEGCSTTSMLFRQPQLPSHSSGSTQVHSLSGSTGSWSRRARHISFAASLRALAGSSSRRTTDFEIAFSYSRAASSSWSLNSTDSNSDFRASWPAESSESVRSLYFVVATTAAFCDRESLARSSLDSSTPLPSSSSSFSSSSSSPFSSPSPSSLSSSSAATVAAVVSVSTSVRMDSASSWAFRSSTMVSSRSYSG
mmetsp:Transcript_19024/g.44146  ORF Transcript_19024/g.44146 Transcript_19024/m.44146 type:complete len:214 (+) Transcript_19024:197-838(+)